MERVKYEESTIDDTLFEPPTDLGLPILTCGNCRHEKFFIGQFGSIMCAECRSLMEPAPVKAFLSDPKIVKCECMT